MAPTNLHFLRSVGPIGLGFHQARGASLTGSALGFAGGGLGLGGGGFGFAGGGIG